MRAHTRGAVGDRAFQGAAGAFVHILDCKGVLDRGDPRHRASIASLLRGAAVDDARFVEMDVGLDKASADEPPGSVVAVAFGGESRSDRGNSAGLNADIHEARCRGAGESSIAQDQIHCFILLRHAVSKPALPHHRRPRVV